MLTRIPSMANPIPRWIRIRHDEIIKPITKYFGIPFVQKPNSSNDSLFIRIWKKIGINNAPNQKVRSPMSLPNIKNITVITLFKKSKIIHKTARTSGWIVKNIHFYLLKSTFDINNMKWTTSTIHKIKGKWKRNKSSVHFESGWNAYLTKWM